MGTGKDLEIFAMYDIVERFGAVRHKQILKLSGGSNFL